MTKDEAKYYTGWECAEKTKNGLNVQNLTLGGCSCFRLVLDIVQAAKETPMVLFHSVDRTYPLVDSIYQDGTGIFHAFQVTLGSTHTANKTNHDAGEKSWWLEKIESVLFGPWQKF
jgi:hypothetical protein